MSTLVARNVWRFYGRSPAVQGLDLEIEEGSVYGFIGPNGAGKSTTLRMLATVDQPDAGRVWVRGRCTQQETDRVRKMLGFMPDPFGMPEGFTVEQFLEFFAIAYRLPGRMRRERVQRAIELTRIGERRKQKVTDLSKGWKQRVLLAKTLINDPHLLLLDEPAAGLDPAARIEFRDVIRTLRDLGKTVIVSSHILTELADFCDSVGIIERGRMLVSGRIEDILERFNPRDRLVFEIAGPSALAARLLSSQEDVQSVQSEPGPSADTSRLVVDLAGRSDAKRRAAIVSFLATNQVLVSGLSTQREGLEDLFLKVAGKQEGKQDRRSDATIRELLGGEDFANDRRRRRAP
jgi:ABC-2 type transport system ATP-binding protein